MMLRSEMCPESASRSGQCRSRLPVPMVIALGAFVLAGWTAVTAQQPVPGVEEDLSAEMQRLPPVEPVRPSVRAPAAAAACMAHLTLGELPEVLMPMTTSPSLASAHTSWAKISLGSTSLANALLSDVKPVRGIIGSAH